MRRLSCIRELTLECPVFVAAREGRMPYELPPEHPEVARDKDRCRVVQIEMEKGRIRTLCLEALPERLREPLHDFGRLCLAEPDEIGAGLRIRHLCIFPARHLIPPSNASRPCRPALAVLEAPCAPPTRHHGHGTGRQPLQVALPGVKWQ